MSTIAAAESRVPSTFFLAFIHLQLLTIMVVGPMVIPNMASEFSLTTIQVKSWTTAMLLGSGLVAFGAGAVSEAIGRRLVGMLAAGVVAGAALLTMFAWDYWVVLVMAALMGTFASLADINMDGYVGSVSKGKAASTMFSRVQMSSDLMTAVLAFVFGVLVFSVSGLWQWFFGMLAVINFLLLSMSAKEYPGGTRNAAALSEFGSHFRKGVGLLRMPAFLCVVGAATFGSSTVAAVVTDGPTALQVHTQSSGWVYGGTFGLLALMGSLGYLIGQQISKRSSPVVQLVIGSAMMAVAGACMILAVVLAPGNSIALGLPMAASFCGHTVVTSAALASAVDLARVESSVGASMLTVFKRLVPLLLSVLLVGLTATGTNQGPMTMSVAVFACAVLGLLCSLLCIRFQGDQVEAA